MLKKRILQLLTVVKDWGLILPPNFEDSDSLLVLDDESESQLQKLDAYRQYSILTLRKKILLEKYITLKQQNINLAQQLDYLRETVKKTILEMQMDLEISYGKFLET